MEPHGALSTWESFYVIVGSSAAALTGLQFVVMALVSDIEARASNGEIEAFATPNVVHFTAVLVVSAVLSAPWPTLTAASLLIGALGVAGIVYSIIVARRAKRTVNYKPVLEDWIWHVALPFVGYTALLVGPLLVRRDPEDALFAVAGAALLLLVVGIHNAWDTVTYIVLNTAAQARRGVAASESTAPPLPAPVSAIPPAPGAVPSSPEQRP